MTDHPSTFKAAQMRGTGIDWDDHATLHQKAGDHRMDIAEIAGLAARDDFPA